jgi:hypothetical protein
MKTFTAQYSRTDYGTIWFEAETKEQAQELMEDVYSLNLEMEDLPGYQGKGRDVFELDHLEEVN